MEWCLAASDPGAVYIEIDKDVGRICSFCSIWVWGFIGRGGVGSHSDSCFDIS